MECKCWLHTLILRQGKCKIEILTFYKGQQIIIIIIIMLTILEDNTKSIFCLKKYETYFFSNIIFLR